MYNNFLKFHGIGILVSRKRSKNCGKSGSLRAKGGERWISQRRTVRRRTADGGTRPDVGLYGGSRSLGMTVRRNP